MDAQEAAADAERARGRRALNKAVEAQARLIAAKYVAPHHRFRHHVPAHRKPVCRGAAAPGVAGPAARPARQRGRPSNLAALLNSLQMGFRTWPSSSARPRSGRCCAPSRPSSASSARRWPASRRRWTTPATRSARPRCARAMLRNLKSVEALPEADARLVLGGQSGRDADDPGDAGRRTPAIPLWRRSHPRRDSEPPGRACCPATVDILMLAAIRRRYLWSIASMGTAERHDPSSLDATGLAAAIADGRSRPARPCARPWAGRRA